MGERCEHFWVAGSVAGEFCDLCHAERAGPDPEIESLRSDLSSAREEARAAERERDEARAEYLLLKKGSSVDAQVGAVLVAQRTAADARVEEARLDRDMADESCRAAEKRADEAEARVVNAERERDAWFREHENLLAVRQQDLAALGRRIERAESSERRLRGALEALIDASAQLHDAAYWLEQQVGWRCAHEEPPPPDRTEVQRMCDAYQPALAAARAALGSSQGPISREGGDEG